MKEKANAEEYPGYREQKAVTVKTGLGKTRRSAITATGVRGYRVTAIGAGTQITVVRTCPPSD